MIRQGWIPVVKSVAERAIIQREQSLANCGAVSSDDPLRTDETGRGFTVKKTRSKKRLSAIHIGMIGSGAIVILVLGLLLWTVMKSAGLTPLLAGDAAAPDRMSAYLSLIGISFSVTFITTSLFGGLSDKSEKIYWQSYPEQYLINTPLNFMVLTGISFLSLAVQVVLTFFVRGDEVLREALFLSAFLIGIAAIVVLSYKFTAAFFSRRRFLARAEAYFDGLVADPEKSGELQQAVVGLFNNTIEAAGPDGCDIARVRENVALLLRHGDSPTCAWWLEQLTVELGRSNLSGLIQLGSLMSDSPQRDAFTDLLERLGARRNLPFDCQEVLIQAYKTRFFQMIEELGDPDFFDDFSASEERVERWDTAAREVNTLFGKIRTDSFDNCCFVVEQLDRMPYDLLTMDACYESVVVKWEDALTQLAACVREKDSLAYRRLQKLMFSFLCRHPAYYYRDWYGEYQCTRDKLGERLNGMTAECVEALTVSRLPFMIDMIEEEDGRKAFMLWIADQMVQRKLPIGFWSASRLSEYRHRGKYAYSEKYTEYLIERFHEASDRLSEEYAARRKKGMADRYSNNKPLLEYRDVIMDTTRLLAKARGSESDLTSSLELFLRTVFARVSVGEDNGFTETVFDPASETGSTEETAVINSYTLVFETLVRVLDRGRNGGGGESRKEEVSPASPGAEADGTEPVLRDLQLALDMYRGGDLRNYFPMEEERIQKRSELLFFLDVLTRFAEDSGVTGARLRGVAGILARVLVNPCVAPLTGDPEKDPEEVNRCLAWFRLHPEARGEAADLLHYAFYEDDMYSSEIDTMRSYKDSTVVSPETAALFVRCADEYENALLSLKRLLEL